MTKREWGGNVDEFMLQDILLHIQGRVTLKELMETYGLTTTAVYSYITRGLRLAFKQGKLQISL